MAEEPALQSEAPIKHLPELETGPLIGEKQSPSRLHKVDSLMPLLILCYFCCGIIYSLSLLLLFQLIVYFQHCLIVLNEN